MDSTALEEVRSHRKTKKKQGREQQQEPDLSAACPDSAKDSSEVSEMGQRCVCACICVCVCNFIIYVFFYN